MDLKAEVFFLIVKLLENEGCSSAAELIKKFIDEKKLLPERINTAGVSFHNTYDNYDSLHSLSSPSLLVEYYELLMKLVHDGKSCSSHAKTLMGIQSRMKKSFRAKRTEFSIGLREYNKSKKLLLNHLHRCSKLQFHILAHRTAIYCLEFDKRGKYVFTGSDDYTIKIWSIKGSRSASACTLRHTLRGHVAEIIELAISADNHLLASIDSNCCLVVWCLQTGQPVVSVRGSRNNRVLSGLGFLTVPKVVLSKDEVLSDSGERKHPSGMLIVSSFGGFLHIIPYIHTVRCNYHYRHYHAADEFGSATNGTENRWICCTVELLPAIRFTTASEGTPNVFWPSIACIDISPGGLLVAAGCSDQNIRLYQFTNPLKPEPAGILAAHEESVNSVAFSHCGLKLATGSSVGASCCLWRLQAGQWRSMKLQFGKRVKCRPCLLVWSIHDQYLIASMKNGSVYIYFGHSGQLVTVIDGHEGAIHAVSPSPFDENILATGGVDGRFQLWNISNLRRYEQQHKKQYDEENHLFAETGHTSSTEQPLLFHHRFPPSELDVTQGLVWRFNDPTDDQPIWPRRIPNPFIRRNTREQSMVVAVDQTTNSTSENITGAAGGSTSNNTSNHSSSLRTLTESRSTSGTRGGGGGATNSSNTKLQRITACRVLPTAEGVGFLVVTKSGVMSLFSPSEESTSYTSQSSNVESTPLVDEQFLHWELDTAEWREVVPQMSTMHNNSDSNLLRIYENTLHVLGSPPAQQTISPVSNTRVNSSRRRLQNNSINNNNNNNNNNIDFNNNNNNNNRISDPSDGNSSVRYTPPPCVLYEIVHAPSGVPFHRLPPGYLTNFRGFPYPSRRQKEIPGRSHLVEPLDLLPSVTLDEETDEDIVVDDIQFCSNIPPDYCPLPQLSNNEPVHGKTYLWCSPWLTSHTPLIESFEGEELNLKIAEQNRKYEEEKSFFCAGGEPVVSFGDDFTASKNSTEQIIIMQPEGNCFHRPHISSQKLLSPTLSKTSKSKTNSCDVLKHDEISGDEKKAADVSMTTAIANISSEQIDSKDSGNTLRVSTRSSTLPQVNPSQPSVSLTIPTDDQDDAEGQDDSSEESEWSAHIDVDIGWWRRQRRRRTRRQVAMINGADISASNDADQINSNDLDSLEMELDQDDTNIEMISYDDIGDASLSSGYTETNQSGSNMEGNVRRSLRQQRRLLLKRRLLREAKRAEARAKKAEIERRCSSARRSRRFLRLSNDDSSRIDEDSTSRDTCMPESSSRQSCKSAQVTETVKNEALSSRRERLKRRLVRSVDYAVMTGSRLPLSRIPLDCYLSPNCEGEEEGVSGNNFILPYTNIIRWRGPYFDWLSTLAPAASPYLPQAGDRVVYLYRGHQDYLSKAWECGSLPLMEGLGGKEGNNRSSPQQQSPWIVWPGIPQFLCCTVVKITYHIVRIAGSQSHSSRSNVRYKKTRKHSYATKCLRQSQQLVNLKDLNSTCHDEDQKFPLCSSASSSSSTSSSASSSSSANSSASVKTSECPVVASTSFTNTRTHSPLPTSSSYDSGDSFVRLITLHLEIEQEQPYKNLKCYSNNNNTSSSDGYYSHNCKEQQQQPTTIYVTYHDVDGILEFIFLRRIFDAALKRKWKPGDLFICPVGDSWWRGYVIKSLMNTDTLASQPSTSKMTLDPSTLYASTTSYLVRWLDENEPSLINNSTIIDNMMNNLQHVDDDDAVIMTSLEKLPENCDHLNAWDMYKWYPESEMKEDGTTSLEYTLSGGLINGYVYISHEQLCLLYGTSKYWNVTHQSDAYLSEIKRIVECIAQIMTLEISDDFIQPVDLAAYPDYLFINAFPIDLTFILNRLLNGFYRQPESLKSDFIQLLENTERYNLPDSIIVQNAQLVCQLGLYCIENTVDSSDILERYKVLKSSSIPSPLNSENNNTHALLSTVASPSSSSLNPPKTRHVTGRRRRRRTHQSRIQYFGRKRKFGSRFQSTEQQQQKNEVCRRSSSRLANLSISGGTESASHYVDNHNSSTTSGGGSDDLKSPTLRNRFNVMQEEKSSASSSLATSPPPPPRNTTLTRSGCFILLRSWITRSLGMIKTLSNNPRSLFFARPINPFKYPQYHEAIENPMDLSLIQHRLITARSKLNASKQRFLRGQLQCEYTPNDMLNDLRLIISNAKQCHSVDRENEMLYDDIIWLESWINDVVKPYLSNISNSLLSSKSQNMDEKNAEFSPSRGIASSSLTTQSGTIRTSSGRIVKPPPRDSSQEFSLSLSDEYDDRSDCSHDKRKRTVRSHQQRLKTPSCSSSNTLPCRNQLHSSTRRYAKRGRPPRVGVVCRPTESAVSYTSPLEDVSNNTLRRSTRKRRLITSYDGLEDNEDWE
ncbi:unnamed protein product [Trichobilharzia szidati]|nr:unnamed protein product [Trichobilharzia szidati]